MDRRQTQWPDREARRFPTNLQGRSTTWVCLEQKATNYWLQDMEAWQVLPWERQIPILPGSLHPKVPRSLVMPPHRGQLSSLFGRAHLMFFCMPREVEPG